MSIVSPEEATPVTRATVSEFLDSCAATMSPTFIVGGRFCGVAAVWYGVWRGGVTGLGIGLRQRCCRNLWLRQLCSRSGEVKARNVLGVIATGVCSSLALDDGFCAVEALRNRA